MEDYLEMIYRLSVKIGFTRMGELSETLNVQPPSATRMVQKLSELNLINYEKYGVIILTEEGKKLGEKLLERHKTIEEFLHLIGVSEDGILEETEKIEHTLNSNTVECFRKFINFFKSHQDTMKDYKNHMEHS